MAKLTVGGWRVILIQWLRFDSHQVGMNITSIHSNSFVHILGEMLTSQYV